MNQLIDHSIDCSTSVAHGLLSFTPPGCRCDCLPDYGAPVATLNCKLQISVQLSNNCEGTATTVQAFSVCGGSPAVLRRVGGGCEQGSYRGVPVRQDRVCSVQLLLVEPAGRCVAKLRQARRACKREGASRAAHHLNRAAPRAGTPQSMRPFSVRAMTLSVVITYTTAPQPARQSRSCPLSSAWLTVSNSSSGPCNGGEWGGHAGKGLGVWNSS